MIEDQIPVAQPYPINVWKLAKGEYLDVEACERSIGVKRERHEEYRLALLSLREFIQRDWHAKRGEVITVTTEHDGIRIHSDDSAVMSNEDLLARAAAKARRACRQTAGVDRANLSTPELLHAHERLLIRAAAFVSGARTAVRAALRPYVRQTPALLPENKERPG